MISKSQDTNDNRHSRALLYAGFVLVAYELMKSMVVDPIKYFYKDTTFGQGMPFKTYEADVKTRHKNEFEACLLYLKDFMEAIDEEDFVTIQELRTHRNEVAHDMVRQIDQLTIDYKIPMFEKVNKTLFKLSNYRAYMEVDADPEFKDVDWECARGTEYILFDEIVTKIGLLSLKKLP